MKFRTQYTQPLKVTQDFNEVSLTDQTAKDECDIGFIIENFVRTGNLPERPNMTYKDCTTVADFEEAQMIVAETKSQFEQLPAVERDKFKTVQNWLNYCTNPDNLSDCVEKGYIANTEDVQKMLSKTTEKVVDTASEPPKEETVNANS